MKRLRKFLAIGVIAFIGSCETTREAGHTATTNNDPAEEMFEFNQSYISSIGLNDLDLDSIHFFNSSAVDMTKNIPEKTKKTDDGTLVLIDRTKSKSRFVPIKTLGRIVKIQRNPKEKKLVDYIKVSFDTKDEIFELWFSRSPDDGSFSLFDDGSKSYSTNVSGGDKCKLLFKFKEEISSTSDFKKAEGNTRGSSKIDSNKSDLPALKN